MKTVTEYAINQKVSIKETDIAELYGLSIKVTGFMYHKPECTLKYSRKLIDGVSGCGWLNGLNDYGKPEKTITLFLKEEGRPSKNLALNLKAEPINPEFVKIFEQDIAALEQNNVTGFFYNYRICNGGANYKEMSIKDAEAMMVLDENGNYKGFTLSNLTNFSSIILTAAAINQARERYEKDTSKEKVTLEKIESYQEVEKGNDVFYGGLIFGKDIKSHEYGYKSEGW